MRGDRRADRAQAPRGPADRDALDRGAGAPRAARAGLSRRLRPFSAVIPGRAKREPGIHDHRPIVCAQAERRLRLFVIARNLEAGCSGRAREGLRCKPGDGTSAEWDSRRRLLLRAGAAGSSASVDAELDRWRIGYAIVGDPTLTKRPRVYAAGLANAPGWREVFRSGDVVVYERVPVGWQNGELAPRRRGRPRCPRGRRAPRRTRARPAGARPARPAGRGGRPPRAGAGRGRGAVGSCRPSPRTPAGTTSAGRRRRGRRAPRRRPARSGAQPPTRARRRAGSAQSTQISSRGLRSTASSVCTP